MSARASTSSRPSTPRRSTDIPTSITLTDINGNHLPLGYSCSLVFHVQGRTTWTMSRKVDSKWNGWNDSITLRLPSWNTPILVELVVEKPLIFGLGKKRLSMGSTTFTCDRTGTSSRRLKIDIVEVGFKAEVSFEGKEKLKSPSPPPLNTSITIPEIKVEEYSPDMVAFHKKMTFERENFGRRSMTLPNESPRNVSKKEHPKGKSKEETSPIREIVVLVPSQQATPPPTPPTTTPTTSTLATLVAEPLPIQTEPKELQSLALARHPRPLPQILAHSHTHLDDPHTGSSVSTTTTTSAVATASAALTRMTTTTTTTTTTVTTRSGCCGDGEEVMKSERCETVVVVVKKDVELLPSPTDSPLSGSPPAPLALTLPDSMKTHSHSHLDQNQQQQQQQQLVRSQ